MCARFLRRLPLRAAYSRSEYHHFHLHNNHLVADPDTSAADSARYVLESLYLGKWKLLSKELGKRVVTAHNPEYYELHDDWTYKHYEENMRDQENGTWYLTTAATTTMRKSPFWFSNLTKAICSTGCKPPFTSSKPCR